MYISPAEEKCPSAGIRTVEYVYDSSAYFLIAAKIESIFHAASKC
jgi:hypothetical protein